MYVWFDACQRHKTVVEWFDERHLFAGIWREEFFAEFYIEIEGVFVSFTVDGNEVLWSKSGELCEYCFYLAGEDVYATNDKHIVAAAEHLAESDCSTSALAGFVVEAGKVAGAIAEYGHCLLAE